MHFVDLGESRNFRCENCPLTKLCGCWVGCLKVGINLLDVYVGARVFFCMGKRCLCVYVFRCSLCVFPTCLKI